MNLSADAHQKVLAAADALDSLVFHPKLEAAQTLEEAFGSAVWETDGGRLIAGDAVVASTPSNDVAAYLAEYDPAAVRRAATSKQAAVARVRDAVKLGKRDELAAATPAFLNLVREYAIRIQVDPASIEEVLA